MRFHINSLKKGAQKIAKKHALSLVLLFGSQARSRAHVESDFDFGVLGDRHFSPREIAEFSFLFSQECKLRDAEVVDLKSAPPLLLKEISKDGILLYEKEPLFFLNFKIYAVKRYVESKPLLALRRVRLERFLQAI